MKRLIILSLALSACLQAWSAPVVYFIRDISPEGLERAYEALSWEPEGRTAVKIISALSSSGTL